MNKTQQEWKTATKYMDSFIQQECEFYGNCICEGMNDKFRDNKYTQCRNCTRRSSIEECDIMQWEVIVNDYRDMIKCLEPKTMKVIICNYSPLCNGTGDCIKCKWLSQVKIIDIAELSKLESEVQTCDCT